MEQKQINLEKITAALRYLGLSIATKEAVLCVINAQAADLIKSVVQLLSENDNPPLSDLDKLVAKEEDEPQIEESNE